MALLISTAFLVVIVVFVAYDFFVYHRQKKLIQRYAQTRALINSLFPQTVLESASSRDDTLSEDSSPFLPGADPQTADLSSPTRADLFLETTILFADIVGFTAWSSTREPTHVFFLLETLFAAFDRIAKPRRVFKVETVGDRYVAATGIPKPRKNHALTMVRFARDILQEMKDTSSRLESTLGNDTGCLTLQIGIHSGPVTAGVLRGEKARFQLFGDTMNTTAQIESTGEPGRIHMSQETAEALTALGKANWLQKRPNMMEVKGKGKLQTYLLLEKEKASSCIDSSSIQLSEHNKSHHVALVGPDLKLQRLIEWNADLLLDLMKQIVAHRQRNGEAITAVHSEDIKSLEQSIAIELDTASNKELPIQFTTTVDSSQTLSGEIKLPPGVESEVRLLVSCLALMHRNENPFHNFEHASHMLLTHLKLYSQWEDSDEVVSFDPLVHFVSALAILVVNVDHSGLPNFALVGTRKGKAFQNRLINEHHALATAWQLLIDDTQFLHLRQVLYRNTTELIQFRNVLTRLVLSDTGAELSRLELLHQTASVAHYLQHWYVYRKWSEKAYKEAVLVHQATDPESCWEPWYQQEIGHLEDVIMPLLDQLEQGLGEKAVETYRCLADRNIEEWKVRGSQIEDEWKASFQGSK